MLPQTRYVGSGDVNIAYQVLGDGPFAVVLMLPWGSGPAGVPGERRLYAAV